MKLSDRADEILQVLAETYAGTEIYALYDEILAALRLAETIPAIVVNDEAGITTFTTVDCATVAKPLHPGIYHYIDELRSFDGRLVGVQFWCGSKPSGIPAIRERERAKRRSPV